MRNFCKQIKMKNLLKITGVVLLILTMNTDISSQVQSKIESYKIGFFTEKLQLSTEESQSFWPLYNQYREDVKESNRNNQMNPRNMTLLNDEELDDYFGKYLESQENEIALKRQLYNDLKKVMPMRKAIMVFFVEREFNKQLLQRMSERRKN